MSESHDHKDAHAGHAEIDHHVRRLLRLRLAAGADRLHRGRLFLHLPAQAAIAVALADRDREGHAGRRLLHAPGLRAQADLLDAGAHAVLFFPLLLLPTLTVLDRIMLR